MGISFEGGGQYATVEVHQKEPKTLVSDVPCGMKVLDLKLDRTAETPLAEQIRIGITAAINNGVLAPGARLPSWLDLAAQLGVARGTVKTARTSSWSSPAVPAAPG
ncbi:GntR family transcriptional regulator [Stutzerimonas degradans]|uniref:GntR family transcriptional regulator n=1 Tax=Stutzerimonas degradans TaxID=2968968 RepID=UPI00211547B5|nr:GntR family transcriptional regulator [Stutzerimonas degradans]